PPIGRLEGGIDDTASAIRVHYAGRSVELRGLPLADYLGGLPMSGLVDVAIDLTLPKAHGNPDLQGAYGTIDVSCPKGCAIGDNQTKLKPPTTNQRTNAFVGAGITFGQLALGRVHVRIVAADGHARITDWQMDSDDLTLKVGATVEFGHDVDSST